ncbi:pimeloyl-ACP methyl ester carboxylesterase [Methylorubrum rhodinum]|uniref:Pimeloyl-ACP methyl ester carboxylesterase n=1 Tax=Methylorubrum rhodinum TaxID=29428 RepID=A0A840ZR19_9HYPH|nr:alpha/beta hydrolase [Methylorubrum rhodinum]MBB5759321.1 pimeloyl-ACP methyl ester carboxylesterase [Methylorubrum rhodinum]
MNLGRRTLLLGAMAGSLLPRRRALGEIAPDREADAAPLPPGGRHRFIEANGIRLHAVTLGQGPPVVLLHGWPQTWFAWRDTMERLSGSFTLIAPDLRGIGLSERTAAGYDKRTLAADIAALIVEAAGGRAHVVGHDMGGKVAFALAYLHPERVDRLVMVDCAVPGTESGDALRGGAWHYGFHMAPGFPEMLTRGRERDYIRAQIRAWSHRPDAVTEAAITEYARHYATPGGMTAGFNLYRALPDDAALAASFGQRRLDMPVLTIGGRHSVGDRLAAAMRPRATRLESLVAEGSGHFVAEEEPAFFCEHVGRFLSA